jgi:outer membrane protein assembly factor BamB
MTPDASSPRLSPWVLAGLGLIAGLAGYWFFDSRPAQSDPARLLRLREASLPGPWAESVRSADWPQWRGPFRDGVTGGAGLATSWPAEGPPLLWKVRGGDGYSSLAIASGRVFTLMRDCAEEVAICWDADRGSERWRFPYPGPGLSLPHGGGPRATPSVDGDRVYFLGAGGALHCLRVTDGRKVWAHQLADEFGGPDVFERSNWGYACSPLVEGGLVFTLTGGASGNALAAFDKCTGKLAWKAADDLPSYSSPIAVTIHGVRQIVFFTGRGLVGVAPRDGTILWRHDWETTDHCNIATPIAAGPYLFISSAYDHGCALLEIGHGPGGWTADLVYTHRRMRNHFATCVLLGEHLYGFDNAILVCMDFRTGEVCWRRQGFGKGCVLGAGSRLLILSDSGKLVLAEATPAEYREKASVQVSNARCFTLPALADGRLYVRDQHHVFCFDLRKQ